MLGIHPTASSEYRSASFTRGLPEISFGKQSSEPVPNKR